MTEAEITDLIGMLRERVKARVEAVLLVRIAALPGAQLSERPAIPTAVPASVPITQSPVAKSSQPHPRNNPPGPIPAGAAAAVPTRGLISSAIGIFCKAI